MGRVLRCKDYDAFHLSASKRNPCGSNWSNNGQVLWYQDADSKLMIAWAGSPHRLFQKVLCLGGYATCQGCYPMWHAFLQGCLDSLAKQGVLAFIFNNTLGQDSATATLIHRQPYPRPPVNIMRGISGGGRGRGGRGSQQARPQPRAIRPRTLVLKPATLYSALVITLTLSRPSSIDQIAILARMHAHVAAQKSCRCGLHLGQAAC